MRLLRRLTPMLACMASQYAALATNFTRSGIIDVDAGSAKRLGHVSDYWLNIPRLELNYAYFQDTNSTSTYPTYYYTRTYGCALRCLVTNP